MTGETVQNNTHVNLQVRQYCQVHENDLPWKSQLLKMQRAIVLGPNGNMKGRFKFKNLETGKIITRGSWDAILTTDTIIERVN